MPSWKSFRPTVESHLASAGIQYLCDLSAAQLNDLYDDLEWDDDNEFQNKQKLTKWILATFEDYKHPKERVPHAALARASMDLRKKDKKEANIKRGKDMRMPALTKPLGECSKEVWCCHNFKYIYTS